MKSMKLLGLTAMVVMAFTALTGVASASQQAFTAGAYPASITGVGTGGSKFTVQTEVGFYSCSPPGLASELVNPSGSITSSVPKTSCAINTLPTTMEPGACTFKLHSGGSGTFEIGGAGCTGVKLPYFPAGCQVVIPPQSVPATFSNFLESVEVNVNTKVKQETSAACGKGSVSFGNLTASWILSAKHAGVSTSLHMAELPAGFTTVGAGEAREFHSELYPAGILGEQVGGVVGGKEIAKIELGTGAGTLKCASFTFTTPTFYEGGQLEDTPELLLSPVYGGVCNLGGVAATVTPQAYCMYTFNVGGSLAGKMFMCQTTITKGSCSVTLPAQTHPGLEFTNKGTGTGKYVETKANLGGLEYQIAGSGCPKEIAPGTYTDGTYLAVINMKVNRVP